MGEIHYKQVSRESLVSSQTSFRTELMKTRHCLIIHPCSGEFQLRTNQKRGSNAMIAPVGV